VRLGALVRPRDGGDGDGAARTIHDFYGFPPALYEVEYPAPGDPWLAGRIADLLAPLPVARDQEWGLDHGTWSVLAHLFPDADLPVVQLAIDRRRPPEFHYRLGRMLAPLREEGVLVCGSGDIVHNLARMDGAGGAPFSWAQGFHDRVKALIEAGDHEKLIDYLALGEEAALSVPTPEHYLPLLYMLGARGENEQAWFFTDRIELASISMLGVGFGALPPGPSPMSVNEPPADGIA
jgi:4,5-DOPA dioxygenase extradiol